MLRHICIVVLLERLQTYPPLPSAHITYMSEIYSFGNTTNAEIRLRFYNLALTDRSAPHAEPFAQEAVKWVVGEDGSGVVKGRMKFCRPVFRSVAAMDKSLAAEVWARNKDSFHPIAKKLIDKVRLNTE